MAARDDTKAAQGNLTQSIGRALAEEINMASHRIDTEDWPRVITDIRGSGLMVKTIARKVGIAPATLHDLASGATREPCYSVGVRLLELREKFL